MAEKSSFTMVNMDREILSKFEVQKFLGKGSYGSVFRVKRISDGRVYALKETNVRHMSHEERAEAVNEIRLQASVRHPNVTSYREAFLDGQRLCIVMEYAPYGDLQRCIRKREAHRKPFPEDLIWSYFIQVCMGIRELHRRDIIHRDIKAANILRTSPAIVKVGDLGIAKLLKGALATTQIGTPHYMPPEVWKSRPYSFSSDVWSLGCLLYELATLRVPFEARSLSELRFKVVRGKYNTIPRTYSRELSRIIDMLLKVNAGDRPSLEQILTHPSIVDRMHLIPEEVKAQPALMQSVDSALLLDTIKVPRNIRLLKKRLPAAYYPHDRSVGSDGETVVSLPASLDRCSLAPSTAASEPTISTSPVIRAKHGGRADMHKHKSSPQMGGRARRPEPLRRDPDGIRRSKNGRGVRDSGNGNVRSSHGQMSSNQIQGRRPSEFNRRAPRRQLPRVAQSEDNLQLKRMKKLEPVSESVSTASDKSSMSYLDLQKYERPLNLPPIDEHPQPAVRNLRRNRIMAPIAPSYFRC